MENVRTFTLDIIAPPTAEQVRKHPQQARELLYATELKAITRYVPHIKELEITNAKLEEQNAELERKLHIKELEITNAKLEGQKTELERKLHHTESHRTLAVSVYNAFTILAVVVLALALGIGTAFVIPFVSILGGFCAAQLFIREARITQRGPVTKVLFYAAGYILLLELVMLINSIVLAASR